MEIYPIHKVKTKEEAQLIAIKWHSWVSKQSLGYGEMAVWGDYFITLGKKFRLLTEFKENGIV